MQLLKQINPLHQPVRILCMRIFTKDRLAKETQYSFFNSSFLYFLSPTYAWILSKKKKDNVCFSVMHSFCSQKKILGMILSTGALSTEAIIIYLILSKIFITRTRIAAIRNLLLKACNKQQIQLIMLNRKINFQLKCATLENLIFYGK